MTNVEKLEVELSDVFSKMFASTTSENEYDRLRRKAIEVQELLREETERQIKVHEQELEDQKNGYEYEQLELERMKLELDQEKVKLSKRGLFWECFKSFFGGLVTAGVTVFTAGAMVRLNNSGEMLTPFEQNLITNKVLMKK